MLKNILGCDIYPAEINNEHGCLLVYSAMLDTDCEVPFIGLSSANNLICGQQS